MLSSPLRTPLIRTGKFGLRAAGAGGVKDAPAQHAAVDVRAAVGTPVYPVEPGVVVEIRRGWRSHTSPGTIEGERIFTATRAGNIVVVRGKTGDTDYGHLNGVVASLKVGDRVDVHDQLGTSGRTGVTEPHLHVGINVRRFKAGKPYWTPIDPTPLLPWDGDKFGQLDIKARDDVPATPAPTAPEEDDMYTDQDRHQAKLTHEAVGRIENHVVQLRRELNAVAIDAGLARWAAVEGRQMVGAVQNALAGLSELTLGTVDLDDAAVDKVIAEVASRLHTIADAPTTE